MFTLLHHPFCPHSRFIRLVLGEYGLDLQRAEERPWERREDFLVLNPAGTTPVLTAEHIPPIPHASIISEYIDETYGPSRGERRLLPETMQERIEVRRLTAWFNEKFFEEASNPLVTVSGPANPADPNHAIARRLSYLGLPAPLFTINFEAAKISRVTLERFFDSLAPMFGHMVSLGQSNTLVLCPALTSHSELSADALREAGITPTTIRVAVGDESPRELIGDFLEAVRSAIDPQIPGFSKKFMPAAEIDRLADELYADVHKRHAAAQPRFADCVK